MRRTATFAFTFLTAALSLGLSSCADNNQSFFVYGVLAPTDSCTVTADPGEGMLGEGFFDPNFGNPYSAWLLLGNQLVPQGQNDNLRLETSRIQLTGAEVSVTTTEGDQVAPAYSTVASGTVDPTSSSAPGFGATRVVLIPAGANIGTSTVLAKVKVFGTTLGNQDVETGEFTFPIRITDLLADDESGSCVPPADEPAIACDLGVDQKTSCSVL